MNLTEALFAQFTNSGLISQITGGLWISEVAPGTAYPYATFRPIGGPVDYQFSSKIIENAAFSFSTYAAGADASLNLAAALDAIYNLQPIAISTGRVLAVMRQSSFMQPPYDGFDQNNNPVFHTVADYKVVWQVN